MMSINVFLLLNRSLNRPLVLQLSKNICRKDCSIHVHAYVKYLPFVEDICVIVHVSFFCFQNYLISFEFKKNLQCQGKRCNVSKLI